MCWWHSKAFPLRATTASVEGFPSLDITAQPPNMHYDGNSGLRTSIHITGSVGWYSFSDKGYWALRNYLLMCVCVITVAMVMLLKNYGPYGIIFTDSLL
jgi:hypothetical protein